MSEQVAELLRHFGFSKQESEIYLTVLSFGTMNVTDIANKVGKARNAVYFHIKNLKEKGLLSETRVGRRQHYVALPPEQLAKRMESFTREFESLIPQINILSTASKEAPMIEVTESRQGYLKIYKEIASLPRGSFFRVLEGKEALQLELGLLTQSEWRGFFITMIERQIMTRALFTTSCKTIPSKELSTENRALLSKRNFQMKMIPEKILRTQQLMFIYGDKVAFLFPDSSLVTTIKHQGIADSLSASFDALYHFASETSSW